MTRSELIFARHTIGTRANCCLLAVHLVARLPSMVAGWSLTRCLKATEVLTATTDVVASHWLSEVHVVSFYYMSR